MNEYTATTRRPIETDLDQPNRLPSTSSFILQTFRPASGSSRKTTYTAARRGFGDRRKQTVVIDARKLGTPIDRIYSLN